MKKSWMKRAISLMATLALALTTAGLAEMSFALDPYDELIVAEAVDAVVESEEMELGDDPEAEVANFREALKSAGIEYVMSEVQKQLDAVYAK